MPLSTARAKYRVGTKVEARFRGGAKYFSGVIVAVNRDGTFAIDYDDGDKEPSVDALLIRTPRGAGRAPLVRASSASSMTDARRGRNSFGASPSSPSGTATRRNRMTSNSTGSQDDFGMSSNNDGDTLRTGMRVEAKYRGKGRFFPARIVGVNGDGTYSVAFDDGDSESQILREHIRTRGLAGRALDEDIQPSRAKFTRSARTTAADQRRRGSTPAADFRAGDRVQARQGGASRFSHGMIERCNVNGTYNIKYDDGDKERNVPATMIKLSDAFGDSPSVSSFGSEDDRMVGGGAGASGNPQVDAILVSAFGGGAIGDDLDDYFQLFEMFDMNANGKITRKEFERGVAKMGLAFSRRDITDLTDHFDKNGDGRINYKDFLGAIEKLKESAGGARSAGRRTKPARGGGGRGVVHSDEEDAMDQNDDEPLQRGDKVTCRYKGGAKYYPGKISRVRANGTYDISYDDGDTDTGMRRDYIRSLNSTAATRRSQSPSRRATGGRGGFEAAESDVDDEAVYNVGDQVEARFQGKGRWYKGKITRSNRDGSYAIAYVDGDFEAVVQPNLIRPLNGKAVGASRTNQRDVVDSDNRGGGVSSDALQVGDQVEARFGGKSRWYSGKITRVNRDGTFAISYTDGDRESSVKRHMIRAMHSSSLATRRRGGELVTLDSEDEEAQQTKLQVGDQVEAQFRGKSRWFKGKITRVNRNGTFSIAYVDGDFEASVARELIRTTAAPRSGSKSSSSPRRRRGGGAMESDSEQEELPLRVGDRVEGRFGGKSRWYKGKIVRVNRDGTYGISYDDGDREAKVPRTLIRTAEGGGGGRESIVGRGLDDNDGGEDEDDSGTYRVGDTVEARFRGGKRYFKGKVMRVNRNGTYAINYDDGDKENSVDPSMMRKTGGGRTTRGKSSSGSPSRRRGRTSGGMSDSELESVAEAQEAYVRGDRVNALYKGGTRYYPGKITRVNLDGTYDIAYDDGDSEFGVNASMMQQQQQSQAHGRGDARDKQGSAAAAAPLLRGDLVEARFNGGRRYLPGRVRAVHANGSVDIEYDDPSAGLERNVRPSLVRMAETAPKSSPSRRRQQEQQQYARGDRVEGRYRKGTKWFAGEIARVHMDGSVDVNYDDGDVEKGVDLRFVRPTVGGAAMGGRRSSPTRGRGRRGGAGAFSDSDDDNNGGAYDSSGGGGDISDTDLQEAVQRAVRGGVDNAVLSDYRAAFKLFDRNGDGIVSVREFERTVAKLKLQFSRSHVRKLVKRFDRNGDGGINYRDFLRLLSSGRQDRRLRRDSVLGMGPRDRRGRGGGESDSALSDFSDGDSRRPRRGGSRSRSRSPSHGSRARRSPTRRSRRGSNGGYSDESLEPLERSSRSRSRSRSQSSRARMRGDGTSRSHSRGRGRGGDGFDSEDPAASDISDLSPSGSEEEEESEAVCDVLDMLTEEVRELGGSGAVRKLRRCCEDVDRRQTGKLSARQLSDAMKRASIRVPASRDLHLLMAHFGKSANARTMPWEPLVDRLSGKRRVRRGRSEEGRIRGGGGDRNGSRSVRRSGGSRSRSITREGNRNNARYSDDESEGSIGSRQSSEDSNDDRYGDSDSSLSSIGSNKSKRRRGRARDAKALDDSTLDHLAEQFHGKVRDKYTKYVQRFDSKRDGTVPGKTFIQILTKSGFKQLSGSHKRQIMTVFGEEGRRDGRGGGRGRPVVRYKDFDSAVQERRSQLSSRSDRMAHLRDTQGLDGEDSDPVVRDALVKLRKLFRGAVDSGVAADYRDVFEMLDQDGSGTVSTAEFRGAIDRLGFDLADEERDKLVSKFTLADTSDTIDYREFLRLCSTGLGPERWSSGQGGQVAGTTYEGQVEADVRRRLRQWCAKSNKGKKAILLRFRRHDKAARGYVRKRDLKAVAAAFKWKLTKEELETLMARFDLGSTSGRFSYREFVAFIGMKDEAVYGLHERLRDFVTTMSQQGVDVLQCFQMFDRNHDGKVSQEELASAMAKLGFPMTRDEARELVRRIDINRDGKVSYAEFVRAFGATTTGATPATAGAGGAGASGGGVALTANPPVRLASAKQYTSGLFYDWTMGMATGEGTAGGGGGGGGGSMTLAPPGSVGAWLEATASPLERRNFFEFLKLVGAFERRLGLQQRRDGQLEDGQVVVQLGSKLKAAIKFYV